MLALRRDGSCRTPRSAAHAVRYPDKGPAFVNFAGPGTYHITSIETIRCLEEGVLQSVADANIGSVMGIGAPPWTGGTLQYVNYVGPRAFVECARQLAARHGARFQPPKLLLDMADRGETFQ